MFRKLIFLCMFISGLAAMAQTTTPNLNLATPPIRSTGWGPSVDANFVALDNYLSGVNVLPQAFWTAAAASATQYGPVRLAAGLTNTTAENIANKGANNGYAPLDSLGNIPASSMSAAAINSALGYTAANAAVTCATTGCAFTTLPTSAVTPVNPADMTTKAYVDNRPSGGGATVPGVTQDVPYNGGGAPAILAVDTGLFIYNPATKTLTAGTYATPGTAPRINLGTTTNISGMGSGVSCAGASNTYADCTGVYRARLFTGAEIATPAAPAAGLQYIYTKTGGNLCSENSAGVETCYGTGGSGTWGAITGTLSSQTDLNAALNAKAALASPTFTGAPLAPTPIVGDNTTKIATTAFVLANAKPANTGAYLVCGSGPLATVTGNTTTQALLSCNIPANTWTANGCLKIDFSWLSSANAVNKTIGVSIGGTTITSITTPSATPKQMASGQICNTGVTNSQQASYFTGALGTWANGPQSLAVDTTALTTVSITYNSVATETINLKTATIMMINP